MRLFTKLIVVLTALLLSFTAEARLVYLRGHHFSLEFPPNEIVKLKNPVFWSNSSTCIFYSETERPVQFEITLLTYSASIDGQSLPRKEPVFITIEHKQPVYIKVSGSASVNLVNLSETFAHAECS